MGGVEGFAGQLVVVDGESVLFSLRDFFGKRHTYNPFPPLLVPTIRFIVPTAVEEYESSP